MTEPFSFSSPEEALHVLSQLEQVKKTTRKVEFFDNTFIKQKNFILDDSPRQAVRCPRRGGKSYGLGLKLFRGAYKEPESTQLYIGLTRKTAKIIMWKDVVKNIIKNKSLTGCKTNESELTLTTPNGSIIYFLGMDSSGGEMEKALGGKLKTAVIDEAGSFKQDLNKLCYENLEPALSDYDGSLVMGGTPTDLLNTLFHKITDPTLPPEPLWNVHTWNTLENPFMEKNWKKRLEMLLKSKPGIENTPMFRRMYLGEWVTDISSLCYKYSDKKNWIEVLPDQQYTYIMGVDLGFNDPTAFVICAYSHVDKTLYIIEAYKKSEMIISDVNERINYYRKKYDFHTIVVDNASKQAVEELKQRYGQPLEAADKKGKAEFIEIMNSELMLGMIKITPGALPLKDEWVSLIWDDQSKKKEEHPSCENHLADAALYAWRNCYQYLSMPIVKETITAEQQVDRWADQQAELMERESKTPWWEK